ncbi:unnamed protein product [Lepeophtheirus salmonis]|uniref:(salmon louse) hypothetical protein n=1 Tax=Lepeophtheirus salmonis TaxID=72036 RepID=A0A7R8CV96_LEPSM|nr:unnamed protein product [Lepeophtheirus salmonis]CAF2941839.1 unnamed protein product [Lepeophtheirus salmonis]
MAAKKNPEDVVISFIRTFLFFLEGQYKEEDCRRGRADVKFRAQELKVTTFPSTINLSLKLQLDGNGMRRWKRKKEESKLGDGGLTGATKAYDDPVIFRDDRVLDILMSKESNYVPAESNYLSTGIQHEIKLHNRREVADWMLEICEDRGCMHNIQESASASRSCLFTRELESPGTSSSSCLKAG